MESKKFNIWEWAKKHQSFCDFTLFCAAMGGFTYFLTTGINSAMMNWNIETNPILDETHWLGFWGSFVGSMIGAIATFIVFYFTYSQNEQAHKETQKQISAQNRLHILPILEIALVQDMSGLNHEFTINLVDPESNPSSYYIYVSNVGQGAAISPTIGTTKIKNIPPNDKIITCWKVDASKDDNTTQFKFKDLEGREYSQSGGLLFLGKPHERQRQLDYLSFPKLESTSVNPS